jgi:sugar lactone lactonase YvrE
MSDLRSPSAVWSRDGTRLYVTGIDPEKIADPFPETGPPPTVCWVLDLKTKERASLALPSGHQVVDLSRDGKTFLTVRRTGKNQPYPLETYLVPLATLKPKRLTEKPLNGMRFSPDGTRVIGTRSEERKGERPMERPVVVSVADGSETAIRLAKEVDGVHHACWSPDGTRVVFVWTESIPRPPGAPLRADPGPQSWYASRVTVCDPDGGNAKVIVPREYNQTITGLDWR